MAEKVGRRREDNLQVYESEPGDYWKVTDPSWFPEGHPLPQWYANTPDGMAANLAKHEVVEHEDGTITVSPSILVARGEEREFHGFLRSGVWTW